MCQMKTQRGFKTELDLNNKQRTACLRHAGAARFAYNFGLRRKAEAYQAGEKMPSAIDLHRELNRLKQTDYPWLYETSKCAPQEALRDLDGAFANFFRRVALKKAGQLTGKVGYPRFKSRKRGIGSFRLPAPSRFSASHPTAAPGQAASERAGLFACWRTRSQRHGVRARRRWFVSVRVVMEVPDPTPPPARRWASTWGSRRWRRVRMVEPSLIPKRWTRRSRLAPERSLARRSRAGAIVTRRVAEWRGCMHAWLTYAAMRCTGHRSDRGENQARR